MRVSSCRRESALRPTTKKMQNEIDTYTNANGIEYYSTTDESGDTIYSFTKDFEDIWSQEDQDLEASRNSPE